MKIINGNNLSLNSHLVKTSLSKLFNIKIYTNSYVFKPSKFTSCLFEVINLRDEEKMGNVIDIGTGSGIIAIVLKKMGCNNVYATDFDQKILDTAKLNFKTNHVNLNTLFLSDLLDNIPQELKFNLVITNPPAYPIDSTLKLNDGMDKAIFSGNDGRSYIIKFLETVYNYLTDDGRFLIAIPSFLDWPFIENLFHKNNLEFRILLSEKCKLPDYGYPKEKFISNFLNRFNEKYYSLHNNLKSELRPYSIEDATNIQFSINIYEGKRKKKLTILNKT